jgi:hypothetical protein
MTRSFTPIPLQITPGGDNHHDEDLPSKSYDEPMST